MARLLGAAVLAVALLAGYALQGVTVVSKASNAAVYLGLQFTQLEFENPLVGTETVLSDPVLDWRDADYAAGPPPWYDDWTVSGSPIDGNANEICVRQHPGKERLCTTECMGGLSCWPAMI